MPHDLNLNNQPFTQRLFLYKKHLKEKTPVRAGLSPGFTSDRILYERSAGCRLFTEFIL